MTRRRDYMDAIESNLDYLMEKHKDVYSAYANFGKTVHEKGGPLDEKTRWLIKVAISASSQHHYALRTHIRKAFRNGCSREEIEHALLLTAPTSGFPTMMESLLVLRKESDNK